VRDLVELLARLRGLGPGATAVLVTLVEVQGSSYRRAGARLLVEADGRLTGVLSGGCLERDLHRLALETLEQGAPRTVRYDLAADDEIFWGFGTGCAGELTLRLEPLTDALRARTLDWLETLLELRREVRVVTVYGAGDSERLVESLSPPPHLLLVGAERDAPPLLRLARELGWAATVVDPRPTDAAAARVAGLARYLGLAPRREALAAEGVEHSARTAAVLATHRYLDDLAWLGELVPAPLGYLAVLGPAARRERLLADLARQGRLASGADAAKVRGPAGLALGGRTPEEVALSIVAEIQATLSPESGGAAGAAVDPLSTRAASSRDGLRSIDAPAARTPRS
jgi:xanthine/CO dehydrogenase XdhC/CoxF family maturation factor